MEGPAFPGLRSCLPPSRQSRYGGPSPALACPGLTLCRPLRGLELEGNRVVVNPLMETNLAGVYAAGDMVEYEGKLDLIAVGFSEAAVAVNGAVRYVDPNARAKPGHSTNLKIFRDT